MFTFEVDHLDWIHSFKVNEDRLWNLSIFEISDDILVCDSGQNLKMSKTS